MRKTACLLLMSVLLINLISGCVGAEGLMQAPRPAVQYQRLQDQIEALLAEGYTYSAPATGDNRHAVQMADLTGEGSEEAVIFLRSETESLLAVFRPGNGEFTLVQPVVEIADSVHSVTFCDLDGDGRQEIIVGWQVLGLRRLSVYELGDGGLTNIFTAPSFSAYTVSDMEETGIPALLIARVDSAEQVVEMIAYRGGEPVVGASASLSRGAEAVLRVRTGPLMDGKPGLFVTSQYRISTDILGEVTDIFTFRDGDLINISVSMETGVSNALVRQRETPAADINGDGKLDLPHPVELPFHPGDGISTDPYYEIRWNAYDSSGFSVETARTYHSAANNWYILIPEHWPERYTVRRDILSAAQSVTSFSVLNDNGEAVDFLHIYYVTQPTGDRTPVRDRTVLIEQDHLLVTAEIIPLKDGFHNLTEQELKTLFNLIPADWRGP